MRTPFKDGLFIAIEGIDGAGKTTLSALLAQFFGNHGFLCCLTKEPTIRTYGKRLRETAATRRLSLNEELELFLKDRQDHSENVILPTLNQHGTVIVDRYFYSNAAYQGVRGIDPQLILEKNIAFAPVPDLVFLLDLDPTIGIARIKARGDTPNSFEAIDALKQVRDVFLSFDRPEIHRIDATTPISDLWKKVRSKVIEVATTKTTSPVEWFL